MEGITLAVCLTWVLLSTTVASVIASSSTTRDALDCCNGRSSSNENTLSIITDSSSSSPIPVTTTATISTSPTTTAASTQTTSSTVVPLLTRNVSFNASSVCSGGNANDKDTPAIVVVSVILSAIIIIHLIVIVVLIHRFKLNSSTCCMKTKSSIEIIQPNELDLDAPRGDVLAEDLIQYSELSSPELDIRPGLDYPSLGTDHEVTDYVEGENTYVEFDDRSTSQDVTLKTNRIEDTGCSSEAIYYNFSLRHDDHLRSSQPDASNAENFNAGNVYLN